MTNMILYKNYVWDDAKGVPDARYGETASSVDGSERRVV